VVLDMSRINKYALVTSSTSGIGKAIGKMFLEYGYYVFFNYSKNEDNRIKLENEISNFKGQYSIIKADLSDFNSIEVLYNEIRSITNTLDCIVLNTAITNRKTFEDISFDEWNNVMNTNLNIPFFIVQRFSKMIKNDGRIIFIGSLLGKIPHAISISYSVSKAGLHMLAKSLIKIFKDRGITVNVVAPGFIDTDWQLTKHPDHRKRIEDKIALGRFGNPKEVAKVCMSIVDNQYINGAVIDVNGGYDME
jgi:3-oxoacyl-[acyl-carrier protein] reductase